MTFPFPTYYINNAFALVFSTNQANVDLNAYALANGWDGAQPISVTINSGVYLYSTSTSTPALTANIAGIVITNNGWITGKGGAGGDGSGTTQAAATETTNGKVGGPAFKLAASGITLINGSSGIIAGGGGGGGGVISPSSYSKGSGGGGGAGGGSGGTSYEATGTEFPTAVGNPSTNNSVAGGPASTYSIAAGNLFYASAATSGGWKMTGAGVSSAGAAGSRGSSSGAGGGGGGWGAAGGNSQGIGRAGGKAIELNGYTFAAYTNNGTQYGTMS